MLRDQKPSTAAPNTPRPLTKPLPLNLATERRKEMKDVPEVVPQVIPKFKARPFKKVECKR